jgi:hypothetical protein
MVLASTLTACGAPRAVRTHAGDPDLASSRATLPGRLRDRCSSFDLVVAAELPGVTLELTDGHCEWVGPRAGGGGRPVLIVGILAGSDGSTTLNQTTAVLEDERAISLPRRRAVFDPETRTLYVLEHGRLWYLQRVGASSRADDERFLTRLGSTLGGA